MKKLFLLIAFGWAAINMTAQTDPLVLKNEGSQAFNNKNYTEAFAKYSEYLKVAKESDPGTAYLCGMSASAIKKYKDAIKYYDLAIKDNYKVGNAYARKALAYKSLRDANGYLSTLEEGLKAAPTNKTLVKSYALYYLKSGIKAQKAGNNAKAKECYKKASTVSNIKYKTNALYSIGVLCYNSGVNILKKAAPLANSNPDAYEKAKTEANAEFVEAKGYLEEAAKVSPSNGSVKTILGQVNEAMK